MNMVAKQPEKAPIPSTNELSSVFSIVARAAADPSIDIDKFERIMQMQERALARQAASEFADAMASMQSELPSIGERGDAAGRYKFALWEDINQAIKPIMQKHGFSLSFRTDTQDKVAVTGVLSHRNGHREETTVTLPADPSGNKNAVQAVASAVSYGKRYTASALLNLTSHGEDDDAFRTAADYISEAQEIELRDLAEAVGANLPAFLKFLKVAKLSDIPAKNFTAAKVALEAKRKP